MISENIIGTNGLRESLVRRCVFNAHSLSGCYAEESMHRKAELAGLNSIYRTQLVREVFFP